jgi:hypothetical protein
MPRFTVDSVRSVHNINGKYRGTPQRDEIILFDGSEIVAKFEDLVLADRCAELLNKHGVA